MQWINEKLTPSCPKNCIVACELSLFWKERGKKLVENGLRNRTKEIPKKKI